MDAGKSNVNEGTNPQVFMVVDESPVGAVPNTDQEHAAGPVHPSEKTRAGYVSHRVFHCYHEIRRQVHMNEKLSQSAECFVHSMVAKTFMRTAISIGSEHPLVKKVCDEIESDVEMRRRFCEPNPMTLEKRANLDRMLKNAGKPSNRQESRFTRFFQDQELARSEAGSSADLAGPWTDAYMGIDGAQSSCIAIRKASAEISSAFHEEAGSSCSAPRTDIDEER